MKTWTPIVISALALVVSMGGLLISWHAYDEAKPHLSIRTEFDYNGGRGPEDHWVLTAYVTNEGATPVTVSSAIFEVEDALRIERATTKPEAPLYFWLDPVQNPPGRVSDAPPPEPIRYLGPGNVITFELVVSPALARRISTAKEKRPRITVHDYAGHSWSKFLDDPDDGHCTLLSIRLYGSQRDSARADEEFAQACRGADSR